METLVYEYADRVGDAFLNPQKRVFWGYLVSAIVISVLLLIVTRRLTIRRAVGTLFHRRVWLSASAKADYGIMLINQALMLGLAPRLIGKLTIATILFESMHTWFDGRVMLLSDAPAWSIALLFTVSVFLMDDFTKYLVHRALHRWPVLWAFHKVHHTAETLTPFTVYRTHPVEALVFALRGTAVHAAAIGCFVYFFGDKVSLMAVLGANAILFFFNALGSNLRHSHVWLRYGRTVEHILISPAQHQIHHSIKAEHHDRNFGAVLAVWDWIGGSLVIAEKKKTFRLGVAEGTEPDHRLASIYFLPLRDAARAVRPARSKDKDVQVARNHLAPLPNPDGS